MKRTIIGNWEHFTEERVDLYFGDGIYPELDGYAYEDIADAVLTATHEVTLDSGKIYREVTLAGVTFGIGFYLKGDIIDVRTIIHPRDVISNHGTDFRGTHEDVAPFAA